MSERELRVVDRSVVEGGGDGAGGDRGGRSEEGDEASEGGMRDEKDRGRGPKNSTSIFHFPKIFGKFCLFRFQQQHQLLSTYIIGMDANKQHHNRVDRYECIRRITALSQVGGIA